MREIIARIESLSHRYHKAWAVKDINWDIPNRGITGLLGSNGAGKSTTMNVLCGALRPTQGNVIIAGINLRKDPQQARREIGFLPQQAPLYIDLSIDEYLRYCAELRLIPPKQINASIEAAKQKCGIAHFSKRLIRNLSGGYRQRVGIAQAIIHRPPLIVLDEPTNGLDPNQILEVRSLIREIAEERAVVFSSHILTEIQTLCKDVVMIEGGQIVFSDTMDAFNNHTGNNTMIVHLEEAPASDQLMQIPGIMQVELLSGNRFRLFTSGERKLAEDIVQASVQHQWRLQEILFEKPSLDEVFAKLSKQQSKFKA
jgi:ABC-2 type transport system ATP-binding protein